MWERLKGYAFRFFGATLELYVQYFDSIKSDLQRAAIGLSLTEYVYVMTFACLLTFLILFPALVILLALLLKDALLTFIFSFTSSLFIELGVFFAFYSWPAAIANRRQKSIDGVLPFATTYMATVAASGAPPITMFKVLAQFKEYGELSREAEKIYRDVEAFGMDIASAIRKTAGRTPSPLLKELLWGLDTALATGANISDFLHEKARGFMSEYRLRLQQFSQTLSLLIEIYLTLVLVGSIFFVIMSSLMSIFGGGGTALMLSFVQFIVVFVMLPVISAGFIILLKFISPVV